MEEQEPPPPTRKSKVDTCASHTEHVICRVCGIEILTKNYARHLASQHPSEDSKNLKPKKTQLQSLVVLESHQKTQIPSTFLMMTTEALQSHLIRWDQVGEI